MAILFEVVQEGLTHADSTPFVLLFSERHVCGLRSALAVACRVQCSRAREGGFAEGSTGRTNGQAASREEIGDKRRVCYRASGPQVTQRGYLAW